MLVYFRFRQVTHNSTTSFVESSHDTYVPYARYFCSIPQFYCGMALSVQAKLNYLK